MTFAKLVQNTRGLDRVKPFHMAFGAEATELEIRLFEQSVRNSLKYQPDVTSGTRTERVRVSTLDAFVAGHCVEQIDFLKTDTEGFDLEVLHGASTMLAAGRIKYILAEVTF